MIFQKDPFASLKPDVHACEQVGRSRCKNVGHQVERTRSKDRACRCCLDRVAAAAQLPLPLYRTNCSVASAQRVAQSRRACAGTPNWIIADEAVSALDVPVQAQSAELLLELQGRSGQSLCCFISSRTMGRGRSGRLAHPRSGVYVFLGRIVETGTAASRVFENPLAILITKTGLCRAFPARRFPRKPKTIGGMEA